MNKCKVFTKRAKSEECLKLSFIDFKNTSLQSDSVLVLSITLKV